MSFLIGPLFRLFLLAGVAVGDGMDFCRQTEMMAGGIHRVVRVAARARVPGIEFDRRHRNIGGDLFSRSLHPLWFRRHHCAMHVSIMVRQGLRIVGLNFRLACETRERVLRLYKPRWGKVPCRTPYRTIEKEDRHSRFFLQSTPKINFVHLRARK